MPTLRGSGSGSDEAPRRWWKKGEEKKGKIIVHHHIQEEALSTYVCAIYPDPASSGLRHIFKTKNSASLICFLPTRRTRCLRIKRTCLIFTPFWFCLKHRCPELPTLTHASQTSKKVRKPHANPNIPPRSIHVYFARKNQKQPTKSRKTREKKNLLQFRRTNTQFSPQTLHVPVDIIFCLELNAPLRLPRNGHTHTHTKGKHLFEIGEIVLVFVAQSIPTRGKQKCKKKKYPKRSSSTRSQGKM